MLLVSHWPDGKDYPVDTTVRIPLIGMGCLERDTPGYIPMRLLLPQPLGTHIIEVVLHDATVIQVTPGAF